MVAIADDNGYINAMDGIRHRALVYGGTAAVSTSFSKYPLVSRTTTPLSAASATRFGMAIRPLNRSAISQTSPTLSTEPINTLRR